jgi:hypothetical protein
VRGAATKLLSVPHFILLCRLARSKPEAAAEDSGITYWKGQPGFRPRRCIPVSRQLPSAGCHAPTAFHAKFPYTGDLILQMDVPGIPDCKEHFTASIF